MTKMTIELFKKAIANTKIQKALLNEKEADKATELLFKMMQDALVSHKEIAASLMKSQAFDKEFDDENHLAHFLGKLRRELFAIKLGRGFGVVNPSKTKLRADPQLAQPIDAFTDRVMMAASWPLRPETLAAVLQDLITHKSK